ncbi:MAG: hypothetical protein IKX36_06660 [Prevotella sp.]|nr:hypothetical protein [Prevotella sp.]
MKRQKDFGLLFLASIMMALVVTGCGEQKRTYYTDSKMLVVERQYVKLDGTSTFENAEFVADVPVKGPQPLLDSLIVFFNEALYSMFEVGDGEDFNFKLYSAEKVYSDDLPNLLASYTDKYRKHIKENLDWFVTNNIFLMAQTESFVTYGVECYHGSASTGSEFLCYTFDKKDGHRVRNLITWDDVKRLISDHPKVAHPFYEWDLESKPEFMDDRYDAGMLHDGILLVNEDVANHYQLAKIAYEDVLPYLSVEGQSLVKNMGKSSEWEECFLGERLATLNTDDKRVIALTVRPAEHDWADEGNFDVLLPEEDSSEDKGYSLTSNLCYNGDDLLAFYVEDGDFVPANVLDGDSVITGNWDDYNTTNPKKRVFDFDAAGNKLYVPSAENVAMGHHECNDRYMVYRYDKSGKFVYESEDGGYWLYPGLRQFGRLHYALKTKEYLIRIDEMRIYDDRYDDQYEKSKTDTLRYRYAAWKNKDNMLDKPDLVINEGYMSDKGYVFSNDGYKYVIQLIDESGSSEGWLFVYKGDKLVLKQCLRDFDFKSTLSFDWDCD